MSRHSGRGDSHQSLRKGRALLQEGSESIGLIRRLFSGSSFGE